MTQNDTAPIPKRPIPRYLYSWQPLQHLLDLANQINGDPDRNWPLLEISQEEFLVTRSCPDMIGRPATYAWINPLSPTGADLNETYGEVLVRIEIDSEKASAKFVKGSKSKSTNPVDINGVDLIYHDIGHFHEWVLLNPDLIKSVTADPQKMRPELQAALAQLKNPNYRFSRDEVHGNSHTDAPKGEGGVYFDINSRKQAIYKIERFLKHGANIVPSVFLGRDLTGDQGLPQRIREFKTQEYLKFQAEMEKGEMIDWSDLSLLYKINKLRVIIARRRAIAFFSRDVMGENLESWSKFYARFELERAQLQQELADNLSMKDVVELKKSLFEPNKSIRCEMLF